MAREHGPHECYCSSCGYTTIAPAYVKCNELTCTACGDRMRSMETGEYRGTEYGRSGVATRAIAQKEPSMGAVLAIALVVLGIGFAVIAKKKA